MLKKIISFFLLFIFSLSIQADDINKKEPYILNKNDDIKLFHSPPEPLFIGRPFELTLVTELKGHLLPTVLLLFRTNLMENYREIKLHGEEGLYNIKIDINDFPGNSIEYFFVVKTNDGRIYGAPVNADNELLPIEKKFVDPVKYFEQKKRLNKWKTLIKRSKNLGNL